MEPMQDQPATSQQLAQETRHRRRGYRRLRTRVRKLEKGASNAAQALLAIAWHLKIHSAMWSLVLVIALLTAGVVYQWPDSVATGVVKLFMKGIGFAL